MRWLALVVLLVAAPAFATLPPRHVYVEEGNYVDAGFTKWFSRAVCEEGGGPGSYLSYYMALSAPAEQYTQSTDDGIYDFRIDYNMNAINAAPSVDSVLRGFAVNLRLTAPAAWPLPADTDPFFVGMTYADPSLTSGQQFHVAGFQAIVESGTPAAQTLYVYRPDMSGLVDDSSVAFTGLQIEPQGIQSTSQSQQDRGFAVVAEGFEDQSQFFGTLCAGACESNVTRGASEAQLLVGESSDRCSNNGERSCVVDADCYACGGGTNNGGFCAAASACPSAVCATTATCGRGGIAPGKAAPGAPLPIIQYYTHVEDATALVRGDVVVQNAAWHHGVKSTTTAGETHVVGIAQATSGAFFPAVGGTACTTNVDCARIEGCITNEVCVESVCDFDISNCGSLVGLATTGVTTVNVDTASVHVGDYLITSTTAGKATSNGTSQPRPGALIGIAQTAKAAGSSGRVAVRLMVGAAGAQPTTTPVLTPTPTATAALTPAWMNTPNTGQFEVTTTTTGDDPALYYHVTANTHGGTAPVLWHDHVVHNNDATGTFYDAHAVMVLNSTIDVVVDPLTVTADSGNSVAIGASWTKGAAVTKALPMGSLHVDTSYTNAGAANDSMHGIVLIHQQTSGTLLDLNTIDIRDPVIVGGAIASQRAYRCRYTGGYCFYQEGTLAQNLFAGVTIIGANGTPTPTPTKTSATSTPTPTPTPTGTATTTPALTPTATLTTFLDPTPTSATASSTPTGTPTPTPAPARTAVPDLILVGEQRSTGPVFGALQVRDIVCNSAPSTSAVNFANCGQTGANEQPVEIPQAQGGEVFGFVCSTNGAPGGGNYRIVMRINRTDVPGECRLTGTGNPAICNVDYPTPVQFRKQDRRNLKVTPDTSPTAINLKCQELMRVLEQ